MPAKKRHGEDEGGPRDPILARFIFDRLSSIPKTMKELAAETGVSEATLSNIKSGEGRYGIGRGVAAKLAVKAFGLDSYEAMVRVAHGRVAPPAMPDRYPSRAKVLHENPTRWDPMVVAAAEKMSLDAGPGVVADEDPGEAYWIETLNKLERAISLVHPGASREVLADIDRVRPKKRV